MAFACRFQNNISNVFTGDGATTNPYNVSQPRVGVRLRRVATQNVNSNTLTSVSWDTEDEDTNGFITVPNTLITIPAGLGGVYSVTVSFNYNLDIVSRHYVEFAGSGGIASRLNGGITANENSIGGGITALFLAGQTCGINLLQSGVGSRTVTGTLQMFRISD